MRSISLQVLCSAPLLLSPVASQAEGFYIGAGAYVADLDLPVVGSEDDITPAGFVGYQFLDSNLLMLSAEVGYYDLGDVSVRAGGTSYAASASALSLAGVAYLPIGPMFEVYAKAGVARMEVDTRIGGNNFNDDGTEVFGGVGFALDLFDTIDIYAEYMRFDNAIDSQMFGVGIRFDFF
jgi:opacity protein-like surface antigen